MPVPPEIVRRAGSHRVTPFGVGRTTTSFKRESLFVLLGSDPGEVFAMPPNPEVEHLKIAANRQSILIADSWL